jgi:transposase-like protein
MIDTNFNSILQLLNVFPDQKACLAHLESIRWSEGVVSPFDGSSKVYKCKNGKYRCVTSKKYFNVLTGTMFENTKIPLQKWFVAMWFITSHKKGISSVQLSKDINVTQKTAWFLAHKIRNCFGLSESSEKLSGTVELDETFVGGKNKNRHADKKVKGSQGRSFKDKTPILGMLCRETRTVRLFIVENTKKDQIQPIIRAQIEKGSLLMTDEWHAYRGLNSEYEHNFVNHAAGQYSDGDVTTNSIEGFWSGLKRGIFGIYHKVSKKHLKKYADEFAFRYNTRDESEQNRFNFVILICDHRLTHKQLVA